MDNMSNYVEAYKCECGHIMPKFFSDKDIGLTPFFAFHRCCPKCGAKRNKIAAITGRWKYKQITYGRWPFRRKVKIREGFIESTVNKNRTRVPIKQIY